MGHGLHEAPYIWRRRAYKIRRVRVIGLLVLRVRWRAEGRRLRTVSAAAARVSAYDADRAGPAHERRVGSCPWRAGPDAPAEATAASGRPRSAASRARGGCARGPPGAAGTAAAGGSGGSARPAPRRASAYASGRRCADRPRTAGRRQSARGGWRTRARAADTGRVGGTAPGMPFSALSLTIGSLPREVRAGHQTRGGSILSRYFRRSCDVPTDPA